MSLPTAIPTSVDIWDTMSLGNCTSSQQYPSRHCLPALWFWWLTAVFFVCLGLSLLTVLSILRCVILRKCHKDAYFNATEHDWGIRGGMVGLGTSSILGRERERWVDIEQRAALYSPDPEAAVLRAKGTRTQRGVTTQKEVELAEEVEPATEEDDYFTLARPPTWFRELKGRDPKDTELSPAEDGRPFQKSSRGSYTFLPADDILSIVSVPTIKKPWRTKSLP